MDDKKLGDVIQLNSVNFLLKSFEWEHNRGTTIKRGETEKAAQWSDDEKDVQKIPLRCC